MDTPESVTVPGVYCIECPGSGDVNKKIHLFFEGEPGGLRSYLDDMGDSNSSGIGRAGSGLAVTSVCPASGEAWLVLFFDTGEKLGMMTKKSDNDSTWVLDGGSLNLAVWFPD
jgi:hypothetical protein